MRGGCVTTLGAEERTHSVQDVGRSIGVGDEVDQRQRTKFVLFMSCPSTQHRRAELVSDATPADSVVVVRVARIVNTTKKLLLGEQSK